jgi:hypothetical protein
VAGLREVGAEDQGVRVGGGVEQFASRGLGLLRVDVDARAAGRVGEPLGRPAGTAVRRGGRASTARDALLGDPVDRPLTERLREQTLPLPKVRAVLKQLVATGCGEDPPVQGRSGLPEGAPSSYVWCPGSAVVRAYEPASRCRSVFAPRPCHDAPRYPDGPRRTGHNEQGVK